MFTYDPMYRQVIVVDFGGKFQYLYFVSCQNIVLIDTLVWDMLISLVIPFPFTSISLLNEPDTLKDNIS